MRKVFGRKPQGPRLERILASPNYQESAFQNLVPTVVMRKEANFWTMLQHYLRKPASVKPATALPVLKPDLSSLKAPALLWFGHSSYLLKLRGFTLLVDPVFSGYASPVKLFGKSMITDACTVADLGVIDYVLITHDHYDHLDYDTIRQLSKSVKHFYTSLGVGAHLAYWGVPEAHITELDWWESITLNDQTTLTATPARHFSGRGIKRGRTLWSSFVLETAHEKLFLGGDSGYGNHFRSIGRRYGPFDLAILECGQYGTDWPDIHTTPEETVQAALDLQARALLPVHWAKFVLALHPWKEPIGRLIKAAEGTHLIIPTPMIGESLPLDRLQGTQHWWNGIT